MKKLAIPLVFTCLCFSPSLFAAEIAPEGTPARKLQRGFLNIALSPISISQELAKEKKVNSFVPSWVAGLGRGTCFAAGRALMGVYEMATFFIPIPAGYRPVLDPEFTWQYLPQGTQVPPARP